MTHNYNEGRGAEGPARDRRALTRQIDMESTPGHWLWLGRVNRWGTPVLQDGSGDVVMAAERVYHLWRRIVPPAPFTQTCGVEGCVRPECFDAPRKRGRTKPARTVRAATLDNGRAGLEYCHANHLMAETRRRTPQGVAYCHECAKVKARKRWQKELERRRQDGVQS